jgi:hypothetical protein
MAEVNQHDELPNPVDDHPPETVTALPSAVTAPPGGPTEPEDVRRREAA